jgi:hypothetical protein
MKENDLQGIINAVEQLEKVTGGHLGCWKTYLKDANTIWQKCPYKMGDRVALTKTPIINKNEGWGWLGSKHFLVQGAIATIVERDFHDGHFIFGLHFDDETWIDNNGNKQPVDRHAMYMFWETYLTSANYQALTCEAL